MAEHTFFFSYARDDMNSYLEEFLKELTEAVRGRSGQAQSDPVAFLDAGTIEIGEPWPDELLDGLQNSKVMVPIYTPRYFTRPVCGQEVEFFLRRQELLDPPGAVVIPVLWLPCETIPTRLKEISFYHKDLPESYKQKGLELLTRQNTGRFKDDFATCVVELGRRIAAAAMGSPALPKLPGVVDLQSIANAFQTNAAATSGPAAAPPKGPSVVNFVYVAGTRKELAEKPTANNYYGENQGEEWAPFVSTKMRLGALAPVVAGNHDFFPSRLRLDDQILTHLQSAQRDNTILVLLVDTWTLQLLPKYEAWMRQFDQVVSLHTSVIVVWNENDLDTKTYEDLLRYRLETTFPGQRTREEVFFRPSIRSAGEFETALVDTLIRIQDRIIQYQQASEMVKMSPFRKKPELVNN